MHNQRSSSAQGSLESSLFHPWPVPKLLFPSTAVLLIHTGPLPCAQRFAEVDAIEFIFFLKAQWQTSKEK